MRVLITGGAGFIGTFTARALLERGDEVVLLDDMNSWLYPAELKEARLAHVLGERRPKLIVGSIMDQKLLTTLFSDTDFDTVVHLAAIPNPARSLAAAELYTAVNVMGTMYVLEAARQHQVERFIFAGSSSVYNDEQTPFREDVYPLRPRSPYGASKAAAEAYCAAWHELYGLSITVLRFFSVYGPWGRPDMAPQLFAQKILNDETLEISQGRSRDLTYIDDVVSGVVAAIDRQFGFEIFNIGRGEPQSLDALVAALGHAAGKKVRTVPRQAPPGELRITYASIAKAQEMLGYQPRVSIEEGAQRLVEWMKTYGA